MELFNLKNMKTINENIKRMLNLMEAQHGIINPLINEQSAVWDNVKETIQSKDGGSGKEVIVDFPSVPFIDPNSKKQLAYNSSTAGQTKWTPLYIGAYLGMSYNPKGIRSIEFNKSNFFRYQLIFFVVINSNITWKNKESARGSDIWLINYSKLGNNQSKIKSSTSFSKFKLGNLSAISSINDKISDVTVTINGNEINNLQTGFPSNPSGYAPNLISSINTELDKYGYPQLPLTFGYNEQIV
jgi:hypothetical protein